MGVNSKILTAQVRHKRLLPTVNHFIYNLYYLVLPLHQLKDALLNQQVSINRPGIISFYEKDHGKRDGSPLLPWVKEVLHQQDLYAPIDHILLVAMPRVFGYVFNPVSFFLCLNEKKQLQAVLCEVNNTFGQTHTYICTHSDQHPIEPTDWLSAKKVFHVSPFLLRQGAYQFRFSYQAHKLGIWIEYHNGQNKKQLVTSLTGTFSPLSKQSLRHAFWTHPLVGLKAITSIHWQAAKLFLKRIPYVPLPKQIPQKVSKTEK